MKIGRNDLCSCGSGKKYKKCCLNNKNKECNDNLVKKQNNNIELDGELYNMLFRMREHMLSSKSHIKKYKAARRIHGEVLNCMVRYFEDGNYDLNVNFNTISEKCMNDFNEDKIKYDFEFDMGTQEGVQAFYNLITYKNYPNMLSLTEIFLEKNKFRREDKIKMLNAMNNSKVHLYKVLNIDEDNAIIEAIDILTDEKFSYIDISASMNPNIKNLYLYNRFITYNDITFGTGLNIAFNKNDKKFNNYLKDSGKKEMNDLNRFVDLYGMFKDTDIVSRIRNI